MVLRSREGLENFDEYQGPNIEILGEEGEGREEEEKALIEGGGGQLLPSEPLHPKVIVMHYDHWLIAFANCIGSLDLLKSVANSSSLQVMHQFCEEDLKSGVLAPLGPYGLDIVKLCGQCRLLTYQVNRPRPFTQPPHPSYQPPHPSSQPPHPSTQPPHSSSQPPHPPSQPAHPPPLEREQDLQLQASGRQPGRADEAVPAPQGIPLRILLLRRRQRAVPEGVPEQVHGSQPGRGSGGREEGPVYPRVEGLSVPGSRLGAAGGGGGGEPEVGVLPGAGDVPGGQGVQQDEAV